MLPILFSAYDSGAPILNNGAGSMIAVLDACLVTGFNSRGVTSMTVAGNVCTVVTATPHGYKVDERVKHAGSATPALIGDFNVASVPSATSYTFAVTTANVSDTTSGLTAIRTPLGWVKEFAGANKAVYKMSDPQSYGQRLRVVDDAASPIVARVMGVEFPTSVDAFADKFPTELQQPGGGYWGKGANNANAKYWAICGDERFFYFVCEGTGFSGVYTTTFAHVAYCFGDAISFRQGEAFGSVIFAGDSTNGLNCALGSTNTPGSPPTGSVSTRFARQFTGITKSPLAGVLHPGLGAKPGGSTQPQYPSSVDNGMLFTEPSFLSEEAPAATNPYRAQLPGFMTMLSRGSQIPDVLGSTTISTTDGRNTKIVFWKNMYATVTPDWVLALKLSADWRA
jgi:hypothetical protein